MKHILLPTDFSRNAWNALNYAVYLFEKVQCTFYLLNACQTGPSNLSNRINKERETRLYKIINEESNRKLNKLLQQLKATKENSYHHFKSLSISDSLVNAISKTIMSNTIDYIFMGTKGSTNIKEIFMGSSTVSVLKNANICPVIAVPEKYNYDLPDNIAFATDFKRFYETTELQPLVEITKLWNSNLHIIYIGEEDKLNNDQRLHKKRLKDKLKELRCVFENIQTFSSVSSAINKLTTNKNIGMIAMINNKHSFFEKLIREAVIKKVAFKSEIPFLVLPEIK